MAPPSALVARSVALFVRKEGEKPTSTFLKSGVPGIIVGVVVFLALCICAFLLYRNRRRDAREAKAAQMWNEY